MFRIFVFIVFFTALLSSTSQANVEIIDQAIVDDLIVVQKKIDSISDAIKNCMNSGKQHQKCMCDNEEKFSQFSKTVRMLFDKHPELKNHDLVHYKNPDGTINNQSLLGIKRQANMELSCN